MRPNQPYSGDRRAFSGPIPLATNPKKHTRFNLSSASTSTIPAAAHDDDIKLTINIRDDSIAVHSGNNVHVFHTAHRRGPNPLENPEHSLLANPTLEKKPSFLRFVSLSRPRSSDRKTPTVALAIKCLKFIAAKVSSDGPSAKTGGDCASADSGHNVASARWKEVEKRFEELTASTNGLLPSSLFGECIGMNKDSKEFDSRLFRALARRCNITNDSINKSELKKFWDQISDGEFDSRLLIFFEMVDTNADEKITEEEVKEIIRISASANKLSNIHVKAKEYAALIMEELDRGNAGYIELQDLRTLLLDAPNQSVRVSDTRVMSTLLSETLKYTDKTNPIVRTYDKFLYFVMDNWQRIWVLLLWLGICGGLFAYKFIQYRHRAVFNVMGYCVSIAKGGAETLKFNMALILLPVCRNTITWLRNKTKLGAVVPFNDNLNFHKVIAVGIAVGVGLHALAHLTCDFPRLLHATEEEYEPMKPFFGEDQPDNYWWFVKGIEGVIGIIMVVLMAIAFTLATPWFRRGKLNVPKPLKRLTGFNAFWYSHHLFVIVYTLLVFHGIYLYLTKEWYKKTTCMYLAVPVVLYACERLTRALRSSVKPVKILKVTVYPGKVLALHLSKPHGFKYKSGQYMFVNCRDVSPFEWHPFSITSAPGDDCLSVHIRSLGDWTRQLSTVFSKVCEPPQAGKSGLLRAEFMQGGAPNPIPYGAPAQDYKKYDVVLLVGLGIGATPMVSIVKDIIDNMKEKEVEANAVENGEGHSGQGRNKHEKDFKTRKAYFYWLTREQGSYEWFKGLMNEVAEMDERGVIELHNHCTSVYEEGNARSAFITMLQALEHAKNGVDVVSGTRVRSHFGKPNWKKVYKKVTLEHPDTRVGVFYCGNPAPVNELKQLALDFSRKTSTKFEFHKENF